MKPPFVYFGGKSRVADIVWAALGDVTHYIEPFAGSLGVLLNRPSWHKGHRETVNDADGYISNFWRAAAADPEAVARYADWPVNEIDLGARHLWLVNEGREHVDRLLDDPDYYDPKVAGWWVWGLNAWIAGGWCDGKGPHRMLSGHGAGISRRLPNMGEGRGTHRVDQDLYAYFDELAERLRRVRVCCGDWSRVVTDGVFKFNATPTTGVFLDPPYLGSIRSRDIYRTDDHVVSVDVRDWAVAHGDDPRLRIVLAGYWDEHAGHVPDSWRVLRYTGWKAYGNSKGGGNNAENRTQETLWFSPHCLDEELVLFRPPMNGAHP